MKTRRGSRQVYMCGLLLWAGVLAGGLAWATPVWAQHEPQPQEGQRVRALAEDSVLSSGLFRGRTGDRLLLVQESGSTREVAVATVDRLQISLGREPIRWGLIGGILGAYGTLGLVAGALAVIPRSPHGGGANIGLGIGAMLGGGFAGVLLGSRLAPERWLDAAIPPPAAAPEPGGTH